VEGESLRLRLAHGPLSIAETTSILRDVARALAYAHERGVVHRDIKPDNVLLSRGTAVVTDFGIAKAIAASATGGAHGATLTQLGTALGTPAYMAPEQAAGDPDTDYRADFYAFGCMAYELLAGRPPFDTRSPQRLLAAHMSETPRQVTEFRPDTPPELARVVSRCLEKEPGARPASADEILATLGTVSAGDSSPQAAMPPILLGGPRAVRRALLIYAVAFIAVAVLAKAAIVGIGLPDWVFPGALIVMALGLPAILFTAYSQRVVRRAVTQSPTFTPGGTPSMANHGTMATIALKASPHLSWRRTGLAGAYALAGFVVLVGAFMLLRALGIGPAGSLLARGSFTAREPVIIADFTVQHTDTALGAVVSDAVRAALSQSSIISVASPSEVTASLRRMARPANSRVDLATAREIAQREGMKAVIDGQVTGVGSGYILTLRLVSADSGSELASFRETGDGPRGLIDAADKAARELRAKAGESLRSVQATPSLKRATTSSLDALRMYSQGSRALGMDEDSKTAIQFAKQAVAIDSNFASAWQLLAIATINDNGPRSEVEHAMQRAYDLRDRLPERERLSTEATYFMTGPHRDRAPALSAYLGLVRQGDTIAPATNAGEILRSERLYARAESLDALAYRADRHEINGIAMGNIIELEMDQGHFDEAQKQLDFWSRRAPNAHGIRFHRLFLSYLRGDSAGMRQIVDSMRTSDDASYEQWGNMGAEAMALLHGLIDDARRYQAALSAAQGSSDAGPLTTAIFLASLDAWFNGPSAGAVKAVDAAVATTPIQRLAFSDRPYFAIARAYAIAGDPDKASAVLAQYHREVADTSLLRLQTPELHDVLGTIALARGNGLAAIQEFRRADTAADGAPARECASCIHFQLGRAFDAAGQTDSAIAEFERYIATPFWAKLTGDDNGGIGMGDAVVLAGIHKRLGELYEAKGENQKAASHYLAFIELWKNADPALQPKVAEVRQRLARLSNTEPVRR
jgi:tetratricopeptide (TPR) repeat protein